MALFRWNEPGAPTLRLLCHFEEGDEEPPAGTVVECPDGKQRGRYSDDAGWYPGPYSWWQLLSMWSGEITAEVRFTGPSRAMGRALFAEPGHIYGGEPGHWRWDGQDWQPLRPGERVIIHDGRPGIWDGRTAHLDDPEQPAPLDLPAAVWEACFQIGVPLPEHADTITIYARRCVEAAAGVLHELWASGQRIALPDDWQDQLDAVECSGHSGVQLIASWLAAAKQPSGGGR